MCSPIEEAMRKRAASSQVLADCDQKLRGFGAALAEICTSLQSMERPNDRITLTPDGKAISVSDNLNLKPGAVKSHFQLKRAQALWVVSARHRELFDAKFRLDCVAEHRQIAVASDAAQSRFNVEQCCSHPAVPLR